MRRSSRISPERERQLAVALASPGPLAEAASSGADMVELRLDLFEEAYDLARLIRERPRPLVVTVRPPREGGRRDAPDRERLAELLGAARLGAEYVDVEWDAATPAVLDDLRAAGARVIVSRHAFDRMPDLAAWADEIARLGPDVVKVVGMAAAPRDCRSVFRVLEQAERPTIAIAMGEPGVATRVLALRHRRCLLTYAALSGGGTAPGQVTLAEMDQVYRARAIGPSTAAYGLLGDAVDRDLLRRCNRALAEAGRDAVVVPFAGAVTRDGLSDLPVAGWRDAGGWSGDVPPELAAI